MSLRRRKQRIGIIGCGAIGSRIAKSVAQDLRQESVLAGLYDIDLEKARRLAKDLGRPKAFKKSFKELLRSCDFVVEAIASKETRNLVRDILKAKKSVLVMSVGHLLNGEDLFALADKSKCSLLIPSGAIAGLDAIKAASQVGIKRITLTTRKPPAGFIDTPYIKEQGIDLNRITEETTIFEGDVDAAVKNFPKNINVAATLALAAKAKNKMSIRIVTSPIFHTNSHEIEVLGDFGRMVTTTDNVVCPDNPKTSYLAVLSAIQTLKQYLQGVKIGT